MRQAYRRVTYLTQQAQNNSTHNKTAGGIRYPPPAPFNLLARITCSCSFQFNWHSFTNPTHPSSPGSHLHKLHFRKQNSKFSSKKCVRPNTLTPFLSRGDERQADLVGIPNAISRDPQSALQIVHGDQRTQLLSFLWADQLTVYFPCPVWRYNCCINMLC
jgi:hypothetical protein